MKPGSFRLLIVGGGDTAFEKLFFTDKNSPDLSVKVVAPAMDRRLAMIAAKNKNIALYRREFEPGDLSGIDAVLLATGNRSVNEKIRLLAKQKGLLVNVADTPDLCDFYLGSVITKGDLKVAISTNGKSPTFAKRIRELFEEILPDDIQGVLENLHRIRGRLKGPLKNKIETLNRITSNLAVDHD
jgi:siroheme synthase-like protein